MTDIHNLTTNYLNFVVEGRANQQLARTGNYADYSLCAPHVCCGWMDLHHDRDYGVTDEQPYFKMQAKFWSPDGVLVVSNSDDEFLIIEPTPKAIRFNGLRQHGFLPVAVAQELVARQDDEGPLYKFFDSILHNERFAPKLVWSWLDALPGVGPDEIGIP